VFELTFRGLIRQPSSSNVGWTSSRRKDVRQSERQVSGSKGHAQAQLTPPFSTGRLVSKKPANGPFLAHQRWKEQEAERKAREARGEKPLPRAGSNSGWTVWRVLKWITLILVATMAAGNFLVKSPFWGYGDQMVKTYRNLVTVRAYCVDGRQILMTSFAAPKGLHARAACEIRWFRQI
jgi:hypothetical protein